jgi:hypothetical protein
VSFLVDDQATTPAQHAMPDTPEGGVCDVRGKVAVWQGRERIACGSCAGWEGIQAGVVRNGAELSSVVGYFAKRLQSG